MPTGIYKRTKPVWNKGKKSGFDQKAYKKKWYEEHKAEVITKSKKYSQAHKKKVKGYKDKYRITHREEIRKKRWWATPQGKISARRVRDRWLKTDNGIKSRKRYNNSIARKIVLKRYKQSQKGKLSIKTSVHNRRLKTKDLTLDIIKEIYADNIKLYGVFTCYLCLKPIEFSQDSLEHKTPLSRGGTNAKDNLAIAHRSCNYKKRNKTESEFREWLK